jgi:hypothetical protein
MGEVSIGGDAARGIVFGLAMTLSHNWSNFSRNFDGLRMFCFQKSSDCDQRITASILPGVRSSRLSILSISAHQL